LISRAEIARCFGSDATTSAIQNMWHRQVRPAVKAINDTLKTGGDPKDIGPFWLEGRSGTWMMFDLSITQFFLPAEESGFIFLLIGYRASLVLW
jgi:hypothetical protein